MGESDDFVIVDAFHGFGGDHGVDDGFLCRLDGCKEHGVEGIVGEHGELVKAFASDCAGVSGREGEEDVAGAIAGVAAIAAEAQGDAARDAFELGGDERSVSGNDDDDGASVAGTERPVGPLDSRGRLSPH